MTDFLDELHADLLADEADRPRSLQTAIGGSNLFGCRAENVLRLNGVPKSDPRLSWEAFVGSAIDSRLGKARKRRHSELLVQESVEYKGVWFTIDEYSPTEKTLRDWKSKADPAACKEAVAMMVESRPGHDQKRAQLHGGAAALIAAGHEVDQIQLVFLPRSGGFDGARLFTEPFSREWADKGVEWAAEVIDIAEAVALDPVKKIDGMRDKPPFFCHAYCPYVTLCRGEGESDTVDPDPQVLDAAQRFLIARIEADEATQRRDYYRDMLRGAPPIVTDGWKVAWSRDTRETVVVVEETPDLEAIEFIVGHVPMVKVAREVTSGKAASLTPRKVRK